MRRLDHQTNRKSHVRATSASHYPVRSPRSHLSISNNTNSEIDNSIIYADYYYLEALHRQKRLADKKPVINESGRLKN